MSFGHLQLVFQGLQALWEARGLGQPSASEALGCVGSAVLMRQPHRSPLCRVSQCPVVKGSPRPVFPGPTFPAQTVPTEGGYAVIWGGDTCRTLPPHPLRRTQGRFSNKQPGFMWDEMKDCV